jgi:hypothetical protein
LVKIQAPAWEVNVRASVDDLTKLDDIRGTLSALAGEPVRGYTGAEGLKGCKWNRVARQQ